MKHTTSVKKGTESLRSSHERLQKAATTTRRKKNRSRDKIQKFAKDP